MLKPQQEERWYMVAETGLSTAGIVNLNQELKTGNTLIEKIVADVQIDNNRLELFVNKADGVQFTSDEADTMRHFSNVMFNIMRGGFCPDDYIIYRDDLLKYIKARNKQVFEKHGVYLNELSNKISTTDLKQISAEYNSADLTRLLYKNLPLTFSRRHGDPSLHARR